MTIASVTSCNPGSGLAPNGADDVVQKPLNPDIKSEAENPESVPLG